MQKSQKGGKTNFGKTQTFILENKKSVNVFEPIHWWVLLNKELFKWCLRSIELEVLQNYFLTLGKKLIKTNKKSDRQHQSVFLGLI